MHNKTDDSNKLKDTKRRKIVWCLIRRRLDSWKWVSHTVRVLVGWSTNLFNLRIDIFRVHNPPPPKKYKCGNKESHVCFCTPLNESLNIFSNGLRSYEVENKTKVLHLLTFSSIRNKITIIKLKRDVSAHDTRMPSTIFYLQKHKVRPVC